MHEAKLIQRVLWAGPPIFPILFSSIVIHILTACSFFAIYFSVDDQYMLIGSANVNQRSMDGQRDTEIAIGCYQSKSDKDKMSGGDIHAYRMSLWYEHAGVAEELFQEPQSLECVQRMLSIGDQMWKIYSGEDVVDMEGVHLVTYPVNVTQDGSVEDLEDNGGNFPDTRTPVKGRRIMLLPTVFTT